jgi:hypothetical protein
MVQVTYDQRQQTSSSGVRPKSSWIQILPKAWKIEMRIGNERNATVNVFKKEKKKDLVVSLNI